MKFSEKLQKIRKDNNLSQEQLADKLGLSRQAVSKWELGTSYPDMQKIMELCKIFNCSLDDLIDDNAMGNKNTKQKKNDYLKEILDFITKTLNMFWSMKLINKIKCLLELVVLTLIVFMIWAIIGNIALNIMQNITTLLPYEFENIINHLLVFIYSIFGIIAACIVIIHIFKIRYLDYYITVEDDNAKEKQLENPIKENKGKKIIIRDSNHSIYNIFYGLSKIIVFGLKIFVILCVIPFIFSFIFLIGLNFNTIYLLKNGILFLGILFILFGSILINYILLEIAYKFIINKKQSLKKIFIIIVSSLILIGLGGSLAFSTYMTFDKESNNLKTTTQHIKYNKNTSVYVGEYNVNYIEDNKIKDIKVEVTYYKDFEIKIHKQNNDYLIYTEDIDPIKLYNDVIIELSNHHRIDTIESIYEINIYASSDKIKTLKANQYIER